MAPKPPSSITSTSSASSSSSSPLNESAKSSSKNKHAQKYKLRVTAGVSYDSTSHVDVLVNGQETLHLNSQHMHLSLAVRIRKFTGLPASSPTTSGYFSHPLHKSDQYSISFSFIPKVDIPGNDLIFGNDFDRPIRDRLPPGFNHALRIATWFVDPGLEGDPYADKPYLYGPALSSWNILRIRDRVFEPKGKSSNGGSDIDVDYAKSFHETVVEEGADGTGSAVRSSLSIPADSTGRKKHFLTETNRQAFTFEAGRSYQSDFGNPFLDFNDFSLKLPGFSLNVIKYVDEKTHELRYVLKNKTTGDLYAVVLFSLLFGDEISGFSQRGSHPPAPKQEGDDSDAPSSSTTTANHPSNGASGTAPLNTKPGSGPVPVPVPVPNPGQKRHEGDFGIENPPCDDDLD